MLNNKRTYNEIHITPVKIEPQGQILSGSKTENAIEIGQVTVENYEEGASFDLDFDNIGF